MNKYGYQDKILKDLIEQSSSDLPLVLGASPGSGKSFIIIKYLNWYFSNNPNAKIVYIPSDSRVLEKQFLNDLQSRAVKPLFSLSRLCEKKESQLVISLPRALLKATKEGFQYDGLVVDEAHLLVKGAFAKNPDETIMGKLLSRYKLRLCVFATGSPYFFSKHPDRFKVLHYSAEEVESMVGADIFNAMDINLIKAEDNSNISKLRKSIRLARRMKYRMDKIIIYATNQEQAKALNYYLKKYFRINSLVSTSGTDSLGENVKKFKNGTYEAIVTVGRLREGFSDHDVTLTIDFACSLNKTLVQQQLCRLNRFKSGCERKNYIRVLGKHDSISDHHDFFCQVRELFTEAGYKKGA